MGSRLPPPAPPPARSPTHPPARPPVEIYFDYLGRKSMVSGGEKCNTCKTVWKASSRKRK